MNCCHCFSEAAQPQTAPHQVVIDDAETVRELSGGVIAFELTAQFLATDNLVLGNRRFRIPAWRQMVPPAVATAISL
jgi:hypothetical protein